MSSPFDWVAQGLLAALAAGLVFSGVVGALLILCPDISLRIARRLSRWVDTREVLGQLDRPWHLEPLLYRHHRVLGASLVAGAAYVLWFGFEAYDRAQWMAVLAPRLQARSLDWIVDALEWMAVATHALALPLGLVILVRPSVLKTLEARANRWYDPGGFAARLDRQHHAVDQWLGLHPRLLGSLAVVGSAYALQALLQVNP